MDLKSSVSGFIRGFFVLKVEIDFKELIRKKAGKGLGKNGFGISYFVERY